MTRPLALSNNQAGPILSSEFRQRCCCTSFISNHKMCSEHHAHSGKRTELFRFFAFVELECSPALVDNPPSGQGAADNLPRYRSADISCTWGSPSIPEEFSSQYMKENLRNFAESPETSKHWRLPKVICNDSSQGPPWGFSSSFCRTTIGWIKPDLVQTCFPACEF